MQQDMEEEFPLGFPLAERRFAKGTPVPCTCDSAERERGARAREEEAEEEEDSLLTNNE